MTKPITPDVVTARKMDAIPDEVIEVFNALIAEHWDGERSVVKQDDVFRCIKAKFNRCEMQWLDVEPIYGEAGWAVEYEKPGFNETGEAFFTFRKANQ